MHQHDSRDKDQDDIDRAQSEEQSKSLPPDPADDAFTQQLDDLGDSDGPDAADPVGAALDIDNSNPDLPALTSAPPDPPSGDIAR